MKNIYFVGWVYHNCSLDFLKKYIQLNKISFKVISNLDIPEIEGRKLLSIKDYFSSALPEDLIYEIYEETEDSDIVKQLNDAGLPVKKLNEFYKYAISQGNKLLPFTSIDYKSYEKFIKEARRYKEEIFLDKDSVKIANNLLFLLKGYFWECFYLYSQQKSLEMELVKLIEEKNVVNDHHSFRILDSNLNFWFNLLLVLKWKFFDKNVFFGIETKDKDFYSEELFGLLLNDFISDSSGEETLLASSASSLIDYLVKKPKRSFILIGINSILDFQYIIDSPISKNYIFSLSQPNSDPGSLIIFGLKKDISN